jgi:hypothetical protein
MCVDCVLASPRIAQADPGRWTPPQGGSVTWRMEGFSPDILQEAEKQVRMVRENLRVAHSGKRAIPIIEEGS